MTSELTADQWADLTAGEEAYLDMIEAAIPRTGGSITR